MLRRILSTAFLLALLASSSPVDVYAQIAEDEECAGCHDDRTLTAERNGRTVSLWVNFKAYAQSVHAREGCVSCHQDVDPADLPHEDRLEKVDCSMCHDDAVMKFNRSLHGSAFDEGRFLAPSCATCHGKHDILPSKNEKATTYVTNIPALCGQCHKEGTRVNELRAVSQRHVLEDYIESIHGDGLFRRGLIVTAVCTSCHTAHDILPHENRESSINRANIATTCQQCHRQIEQVHAKVIDGRLWEQNPNQIPICVDCHQPHQVRRVAYTGSYPDTRCMSCHSDQNLKRTLSDGTQESLFVDEDDVRHSMHKGLSCISCHTQVAEAKSPVCRDAGPVECESCHAEQVADFQISMHGQKRAEGSTEAPQCTTCHGDHKILGRTDPESPVFARNLPGLCADCHTHQMEGTIEGIDDLSHYNESIHGKGLIESGLLVTATCVDCHTAHRELPKTDERSTVHPSNVAGTCATCHDGIMEEFNKSIHSASVNPTDKKLPSCNDCHQAHTISRTDGGQFRQQILQQCGDCHEEVTESYFETFHGKVSQLGSDGTAKCSDCHGAHAILPPADPASTLSRENVVETCKSCHPNSNRQFVGYLTHATHHDKDKYPWLYYTFWFMTTLLLGVFSFFGLHTILWLPRAIKERRAQKERRRAEQEAEDAEYAEEGEGA